MHTGSQLKGEECQFSIQYLIISVVQYSTHVLYTVAVHKSLYLYVYVHYKKVYTWDCSSEALLSSGSKTGSGFPFEWIFHLKI